MDSTPRIRRIVNCQTPGCGLDDIKEWLQEEFPTAVTDVAEVDVQIESDLLSQGREEALA